MLLIVVPAVISPGRAKSSGIGADNHVLHVITCYTGLRGKAKCHFESARGAAAEASGNGGETKCFDVESDDQRDLEEDSERRRLRCTGKTFDRTHEECSESR